MPPDRDGKTSDDAGPGKGARDRSARIARVNSSAGNRQHRSPWPHTIGKTMKQIAQMVRSNERGSLWLIDRLCGPIPLELGLGQGVDQGGHELAPIGLGGIRSAALAV